MPSRINDESALETVIRVGGEASLLPIFESVPISLWIADWSAIVRLLDDVRHEAAGDWVRWLREHPVFVEAAEQSVTVREVNTATLRMFGVQQKEQIYQASSRIFGTPEARRHFINELCAWEQGELSCEHETILNKIDGSPMNVFQKVTFPERRSDGCVLISIIDITFGRRAELERDRFFELSEDLFAVGDFEGRYTRLNRAWEKTLGYARGELLGTRGWDLIHPADRKTADRVREQVLSGTDAPTFELRYRCKDGSHRWILGKTVSDVEQKLIYFTGCDITQRKVQEEEIQKLNGVLRNRALELEALNAETEAFSYSASHDLGAPLRHIRSFTELLAGHPGISFDATARRYLDVITSAVMQLRQIVDDILLFGRLGNTPPRLARVDNDALVADILRSGHYEDNGREIEWDIGLLGAVRADEGMLRQVWINLIGNAVKYTSKNSLARISIGGNFDVETGEQVFSVKDNGVGFDMAYVGKLFSAFQRLHESSEFEGTGIGLASVRRIISRHGGRTWAEGKVGEGASFYFSLPFISVTSQPDESRPSFNPKHILKNANNTAG